MELRALLSILQCPATGQELVVTESSTLRSRDGSHEYAVVAGVPILIDTEMSVFAVDGPVMVPPIRHTRARRKLARLLPSTSLNAGTRERIASFYSQLDRTHGRPRVLIVGGGTLGAGLDEFVEAPDIELVEGDVYLGPRVNVVCDGHGLPFVDGSFDGVVVQAVLEHVLDPRLVVAEIHRVLKSTGIVYAETPFMQQVHEGAFDFTRFTELGHRRLFRDFAQIDRGIVGGPATSLLWAIRYFARALPRNPAHGRVLDKLAILALFWLKYLDSSLMAHPAAHDGAFGVYFMGRRSNLVMTDSDLVASYVGGCKRVTLARGNGLEPVRFK